MRKALALFLAWIVACLGALFAWWKRRAAPTNLSESAESRQAGEEESGESAFDLASDGALGERPAPPNITAPLCVSVTRIMRVVAGLTPQLVSIIPNAIPTSYRGKVELFTRNNNTFVCQHLPHPGGKDYLLYPLEDVPLTQEELKRAERLGATVVVTLQNGRVIEAKVPHAQEWGRGLWQQRSGWYRGGR